MSNDLTKGDPMSHDQFKEWLQLLMYNELTADEHATLEKHLAHCGECKRELEDLKEFHTTLSKAGAITPDDQQLSEARQQLRVTLRAERMPPSLWNSVSGFITDLILPNYKIALGVVAMLAGGILIGRFVFTTGQNAVAPQATGMEKVTTFLEGDTRITNIRFIDSDASGNTIEFTFDAVSPVHMKGNINDARVQKVLAHALVNDQNPGVRLRSVNALSTQIQKLKLPDKDVKAALILALKTDANPGVRREALRTLQGFPFDEEIKQAFLHVLMHDNNSALRIAAINSLDSSRVQGQPTDKDLLEVLKQRMQSDDNNYVRIRAKAVLEEGKPQ